MATHVTIAPMRIAGPARISVILTPQGDIVNGICASVNLSPSEARKMVQDIQYELAQLGTAAALGEVVS